MRLRTASLVVLGFSAALALASCAKPVAVAPSAVPGAMIPDDPSTKGRALAVSLSIQNNQWDVLDGLLAPGFTYSGDGMNFNRDEYIGFMQDMKTAFTDMKMTFEQVQVDGEYVTIRFTSRAKNEGSFMGSPATGRPLEVHGTLIRQMRDGKAIREWQTTDLLGLMTQMGFKALAGYAVAVGLFHVESPRPVRKP